MRKFLLRPGLRLAVVALMLLVGVLSPGPVLAATGPDYAITGGWFFTQTGGGQGRGFVVSDTLVDARGQPIKFWTAFQRLGGVATLGYPIGQPYLGADGFTYQPFQREVLQWRPELDGAVPSNTFEQLSTAGRDDWLLTVKGIPRGVADDGSGGDYQKAVATRLSWLTNDLIRAKFLANPNPREIATWSVDQSIQLYGLPMSPPERHGPFLSQRFQRVAFQLWLDNVPGMPAPGSVVGVLGGDLLNESGLLPPTSTQPLGPGGVAIVQPAATPVPQTTTSPSATWPWHVTYVTGYPNCGTTYIRAYTRDKNGLGVSGLILKSWNAGGNVYIATSRYANGTEGYWDRIVSSGPSAGTWYVQLLDGNLNPASAVVTVNTTANCDPNQGPAIQEVEMAFQPS